MTTVNASQGVYLATTDDQRREVGAFLKSQLPYIADDAVPLLRADEVFAPIVAFITGDDEEIIAAALTCRAQIAAAMLMNARMGLPHPTGRPDYSPVMDKHSELDLIAVAPDHSGTGHGSALMDFLEAALRERGVRFWFGNAVASEDVDRLRVFYESRGFTTTAYGERLPQLMGRDWVMPNTEPPAFYFYKKLHAR